MLAELLITDFAIIDRLHLKFAPGFVVFTGETGAGKSIIIDAVELLLGGKADATMVRAGAETARIEATFRLPSLHGRGGGGEGLREVLAREELLDDESADEVRLAREVKRDGSTSLTTKGRSVCRLNGRHVNLALLQEIGELLVDVHGQSEHLSLLRPREHLFLLDRFAAAEPQREEFAAIVRELNALRKELNALCESERERERRLDVLNFQVSEIGTAKLQPGEEQTLTEERTRLANAEKLASLADEAIAALTESTDESRSASELLGQAMRAIAALAGIDSTLNEKSELARSVAEQLNELAGELRDYRDRLEFNPARLELVDDRLHLLRSLQRKYGSSSEAVITYGEQAQEELDTLTHSSELIAELQQREEAMLHRLGGLGAKLSDARRAAAKKLAKGIEQELADLRMEGAKFGVAIEQTADTHGAHVEDQRVAFDATGLDRLEFLVAPNVGEGLKPLVKIASGGETARLMLALKGVLARADRTPTLIFDEIDQGLGGRVGGTVGRKLWNLASSHQVLCITHLPQLAGYGDQHFKVEKQVTGARTTTTVTELNEAERVAELSQMLGVASEQTQQSAEELLRLVREEKKRKG